MDEEVGDEGDNEDSMDDDMGLNKTWMIRMMEMMRMLYEDHDFILITSIVIFILLIFLLIIIIPIILIIIWS